MQRKGCDKALRKKPVVLAIPEQTGPFFMHINVSNIPPVGNLLDLTGIFPHDSLGDVFRLLPRNKGT